MRYFGEISFHGGRYCGWQSQKNNVATVQSTIEGVLSTLCRKVTPITGCGRTDSGVHAKHYYFHFDAEEDPVKWIYKINTMLPRDIVLHSIFPVHGEAHARFDAISRTYHYHLHTEKNPFNEGLSYFYRWPVNNAALMQEAALIILDYQDFTSFCKSKSDVVHKVCHVSESFWEEIEPGVWKYTITANRFLRGMVRLIVGMCLQVQRGNTTIAEVRNSIEAQSQLKRSWSVPPEGLYLDKIRYPWLEA
ncbi:MAG TPA: tRNA pseudouridine(38-40) synthase TruA [Saprospiraceae bacterium]|nr:tRNA pseudouridine(38-40) synthase TruA [Saprospiraceae bacterium]